MMVAIASIGLSVNSDANSQPVSKQLSLVADHELDQTEALPDEIIIKFKSEATGKILRHRKSDLQAGRVQVSESMDKLNRMYRLKSLRQVFPRFNEQQANLRKMYDKLKGKDNRNLNLRQRHLLRRLTRMMNRRDQIPAMDRIFVLKIDTDQGQSLSDIIDKYHNDPSVEYAEPNYRWQAHGVPNDPYFNVQWALHNTGQSYPIPGNTVESGLWDADIDCVEAWDITLGDPNMIIAVIDTGVDYTHQDLQGNLWINIAEQNGVSGQDDDGNGYIDDIYGYDFASDDADPMDDNGHGTHCAGIIAARGNNGMDITGICQEAKIMSMKFLTEYGSGLTDWAISCIYYAVNNGADVLSNSWGGADYSDSLNDAFEYARSMGVISIASAGNSDNYNAAYPAWYASVMAVSAIDSSNQKADFSNYGIKIDIAAPGVNILSLRAAGSDMYYKAGKDTWGNRFVPYGDDNATMYIASGTSMACPQIAGVAAMLLANQPTFTPDEVRSIIKMTSDQLYTSQYIGQGRVNLNNALAINHHPVSADLYIPSTEYRLNNNYDLPLLSGTVELRGTAIGPNFHQYNLYVGEGLNPYQWTLVHSSSVPVNDDILYDAFDVMALKQGSHTIKLEVTDTQGYTVEKCQYFNVKNIVEIAPTHYEIVRGGGDFDIQFEIGSYYTLTGIEWGEGYAPAQWHSDHITLHSGQNNLWATWNTDYITEPGIYTLNYLFNTASGPVDYLVTVYVDPRLKEGWPVYLDCDTELLSLYTRYYQYVYPSAVDLNGDGQEEIVIVERDQGDIPAKLRVYNNNGTLQWSRDLDYFSPATDHEISGSVPTFADLDSDGMMEIIVDVGASASPTDPNARYAVYAIRHDGTDMSGNWPVEIEYGDCDKMVADLNGDYVPEIILVSTNFRELDTAVYILDPDGNLIQNIYKPGRGDWIFWYDGTPWRQKNRAGAAVGQFDSDPDLEIVVPYGESCAVYNMDGTFVSGWPYQTDGTYMLNHLMAGDMDNDGQDEVIALMPGGCCNGGLYVFHGNGSLMAGWPQRPEHMHYEWVDLGCVLLDVNHDGQMEIGLGSADNYLLDMNGNIMPGWPQDDDDIWASIHSPLIAGDINGDGQTDLIRRIGGFQPVRRLEELATSGGIIAFNSDGSQIDLNPYPENKAIWMELDDTRNGLITVSDIDQNGKVDMINFVHETFSFGNDFEIPKFRSAMYVWELDSQYQAEAMSWPTWQHDYQRTGRLLSPVIRNSPAHPWNLDAMSSDLSSIMISWDDHATNEDGFILERSANGGAFEIVADLPANQPSYTDTNLSSAVYTYRIRAYNATAISRYSNEATVTLAIGAAIHHTNIAPSIDGAIDEMWDLAPAQNIANVNIGSVSSSSDLSATWRGLWTGEALCLLIDVTDESLRNDSGSSWWDDDTIEIYIDSDNSKYGSYDGVNDYQYGFRYNDGTIHIGQHSIVNTQGIVFVQNQTSTGYRLELSIPWTTLNSNPVSGQVIGIDVSIDDDDNGGGRDAQIAWNDTTATGWFNPSVFGEATLIGSTTTGNQIKHTSSYLTIDSQIDAAWNDAAIYGLPNLIGGQVSSDSDLYVTWRALWNDYYLYYLIEVNDDQLVADSGSSWWHDDTVELFIDADNSKTEYYDGINDFQYGFQPFNTTIRLGDNSATNTSGITHSRIETSQGYRLEIAIPWSTLGASPYDGMVIGLDVHVDDDDNGQNRDAKKAWFGTVDLSHVHPNLFGEMTLVD